MKLESTFQFEGDLWLSFGFKWRRLFFLHTDKHLILVEFSQTVC